MPVLNRPDREPILAAAFESSLNCVVVMDEDGYVLEFNPAAERTFGYTREEAVGRSVAPCLRPQASGDAHRVGGVGS